MERHATRESEIDTILRERVLVDLYTVVRQSVMLGQSNYSLKAVEELYGKRNDHSSVKGGDESILRFEEWLALQRLGKLDNTILEDLEQYNEADCKSAYALRGWLLDLKQEAEQQFKIDIPFFVGPAPEIEKDYSGDHADLKRALRDRIGADFDPEDAKSDDPRLPYFLAPQLLEYHWRERKPVLWQFHKRSETYHDDPEQLIDDSECLLNVRCSHAEPKIGKAGPTGTIIETYEFPTQLFKSKPGAFCFSAATKDKIGTLLDTSVGTQQDQVRIERGKKFQRAVVGDAIIVRDDHPNKAIRDALTAFAIELLTCNGAPTIYRGAFDLLRAAAPRFRSRRTKVQPDVVTANALVDLVRDLDNSYLFIQGPPGSGKTYQGAHLAIALIDAGYKVAVSANSHQAIHNLLDAVEKAALDNNGFRFRGYKKCTEGESRTEYFGRNVTSTTDNLGTLDIDLYAGTPSALSHASMRQKVDFLLIDEAGQVALPTVIAATMSARSVILLGDPAQLPQVAHGRHPMNVGASVLDRLLAEADGPVTPERGVLLEQTRRMHPDICRYISTIMYRDRLASMPGLEKQCVSSDGQSGAGLRFLPVAHRNNRSRSIEEATRIADEVELLLKGSVTDAYDMTRQMTPADIIVVTPYNAQVDCIARELRRRGAWAAVEVGTVDKFQGQEAFVVFFSTAASSAEDAARGLDFIFNLNRLNVAISRARALSVIVGSPDLLLSECSSVKQMRQLNAVLYFHELAKG